MKIAILGGGNMGMTYAQSFLRHRITTPDSLMVLCRSYEKANQLSQQYDGAFFSDPRLCVSQADILVLAVKPQDSARLFEELQGLTHPEQIVISIMAGVRMDAIAAALGMPKIIRAMPNLPAQIGEGVTAFTSSEQVTRVELIMVQNLLNATGKTLYVERESMIDAATAISGSGPAYVFYFMQAMMQAARDMASPMLNLNCWSVRPLSGQSIYTTKANSTAATGSKKSPAKAALPRPRWMSLGGARWMKLYKAGLRLRCTALWR